MTYDNFLKLLDEFEEIQSFTKKIEFANRYFQKIGSGSGRIVYDIDGTKVFKLAKNTKGVAQNEAEINIGSYQDTHNIVTKVLESNNNGSWIISEKAKKVNESRIKQLTGIPSLNDLFYFLRNHENAIKGGRNMFHQDEDIHELLNDNEFAIELEDIMANYSVSAGDLGRPSTYGEVLRDGQPTIVLSDYGLTGEVYDTHYSPSRKKNYRMYELYNNNDGNDDILGDMPPQDAIDTRRGMWAQLPYSVSDGSGVINEDFISFILDRDKYPTRILPSAPYIVDEFHNCVNNIDETLNHVKNKKKFYKNLLKLQEYLIEQKLYDREPLGEIKYLNEDGSALYSTDNAMGQDNFPTHNNIDTSPSIRNDLDANINIEEDLEYRHVVGDATEDQYALDEERKKSYMAGSSTVEVKKKCRLAGNGNTSTACNQGDINNLNIKPLKEAQNPEFTGYNADVDKIEQSEKSYLNKVTDNYLKTNRKFLQSYLTPEEMQIVDTWIASDFKTGDRDDDKDAYTVRMKGIQALQTADPETYAKFSAEVQRYLDTSSKVRKFFLKKKFDLDKKYPGDARFGMAGDINVSEVSHFTTTDGAIDILDDGYIMQNDEGGVSTTSNKNLVKDIQPVFYHPQSSGYEGVTYRNLSTQFVLDFNKIKADGIKFKKGNENRGTHIGEDEIRIYPEDGELDVYKYLKKVIIDSEKKQNPESYNKLIETLKEKNIQYFIKNKSQNPDIIQEEINEEISASEAYTDQGAIKTVLSGKRKIGFVHINKPIAQILEKKKIGVIPVRMTSQNTMIAIIYRDKIKAYLLYQIAKRHGGYLDDKTPEEAREIGQLLEYKEEDINDFIRKNYGNKIPVMPERSPDDFNDLAEDVSFDFWDLNEEKFPEGIADVAAEKQFGIKPLHQDFEDKFNREEKEDVVYVNPTNDLVIIRNPKILNDIGTNVRGVIDSDGNLYTEQKTSSIHFDILSALDDLGLVVDEEDWAAKLPTNFVTVQRYIKTNKYCLGESNYPMYQNMSRRSGSAYWEKMPTVEQATPVYQKFMDRARQKNPSIEFINEPIQYYVDKQEKNAIFESKTLNEGQIMALNYLPFKEDVEEAGGKIYSVGGAVRDEILGKESKDLDILITGVPFEKLEEILSKYGAVNAVGKSFGILKFKPKGATEDIDIAIPRTETPTGEGGHQGFDVKSDHNLSIEKDLERRDFTINAIAKDAEGNIVDPFGGQEDIKNKIIRVVNPQAFSDDPLRMLRAVQFASRFGFTIEPETIKMIQENASRVKEIAPERILTEFDKIIKKGNILTGAELLMNTGLYAQIFGGRPQKLSGVFTKVRTMGEFIYLLSKNLVNDPAEFFKNNLKGDENTYREIKALQLAYESGEATNLIEARSVAHNMYVISPTSLQSQILPNVIKTAAQELLEGKYPKTVNELTVNGNDLMKLGLQGKAIGDMQKSLLLKIYSNKIRNDKEELLNLAGQNKPIIKEDVGDRIEYGALLLFLDLPIWNKITSIINKDDLYIKDNDYGVEKDPHVTILYGFHDEVTAEEVFDLYKLNMPLKPIELRIKGINIFETFEFDVVKFDVESDILTKAHDIMKDLPNTEDFPDYHPHITIAYVKKGEGKKYVKPFEKERTLRGSKLVYSTKGQRGDTGENLILGEGVADRYAEKQFNIPDPNTQSDVQVMGDIQKETEKPIAYVASYNSNKKTPIYLNPKSLTNFANDVRAIVNNKGDLYVAQENSRFNHGMMAQALGLSIDDNGIYNDMNEYQLLHRVGNTNAFGLGDTAQDFIEQNYENKVYLLNILRQAKRKNSQYDFYNEYYDNIKDEPVSLNEFAYPEEKNTWNINRENVDISFFVEKYDIWNQGEYADPSEASVFEFLQNNYEDFINDEKLKKELLVALTDRNVLDETVLNEMSIQTMNYTDVITPEYIKQLEMIGNYDRYIEYYQYEENMVDVDKEEIEKTEDFKKWFTYELNVRFDDAVDNIKDKIKPDGTIDIWRRIKVDDIWVNHLLQAGKHLGIYWSWDERAAEAHWGDTAKNSNALIKSSIREEYIDWKNTIHANMDLSVGEDEKEIRLFKNTLLKIEELNIDGQDVDELQLRSKTFYA